jgi:hypothetical protein
MEIFVIAYVIAAAWWTIAAISAENAAMRDTRRKK